MKNRLITVLLLALVILCGANAFAGIQFTVNIAPPPIAVFDQPPCPGDGYIWTPGYYQYGDYGYYWVAGQWVLPPSPGLLWTPGYWGREGRKYVWHEGYWGPQVGFYGGINYGNGYAGAGFTGGHWEGKVFMHNTAISGWTATSVHTPMWIARWFTTSMGRTIVQWQGRNQRQPTRRKWRPAMRRIRPRRRTSLPCARGAGKITWPPMAIPASNRRRQNQA